LVRGRAPLPGAAELLERIEDRFVVASNDAEHTPSQLATALRRIGLAVPPDRIVLAGTATLDLIAAERPEARLLLLGSPALRRYASRLGLRPVEERPDIVVIARDRHFSFARLAAGANAVRAGAALVATNPDRSHPGPGRTVVPETGTLLAALLSCAGEVPYRVIGKPEPALFLAALDRLGAALADAIVIGDNPDTDGLGARRLGMRYLRVDDGQLVESQYAAAAAREAGPAKAMLGGT
jgi:HAD superfamily hydrolase (TIGR01450 family)